MSQKIHSTTYGILLALILASLCFLVVEFISWTQPVVAKPGVGGPRPTPGPGSATGTIEIVVSPEIFSQRNLFNQIITPIPTPTKAEKPTPTPTTKLWAIKWKVEAIALGCITLRDYTNYTDTICEGEIKEGVLIVEVNDIDQTVTIENVETKERDVLEVGVERQQ